MAFGSMLGARFKKKKVPMEKETGNWMEMALDPWIFALGFWQRIPQKFHQWLRVGSSLLGCPTKPQQGFPVTKEGQEL